ncbi:MAG TPA: transglutaminaseTgpA domain-containing protein [Streptosporangiaceae bacterium]|nr:transglutaminaseTgpA domain-containing protein [Streptosporangiaceae bacterium]
MSHRLTIAAAIAVILASVSEFSLISGAGWLLAVIGAVVVVALAGTVTRLAPVPAAIAATALAAIACVPAFEARLLLVKLAGGAVVACGAVSASRVRAFRLFAGIVTYLGALLLYLNVLLAPIQSWAAFVPTIASLRHLVALAGDGSALASYAPPVSGAPGVLLLAAGSIGLAAIVVDLLAVRLRKPAIAGLPLLVLYMAPIATTAKQGGIGGVFAFLLAASGYLALLSSDGRSRLRGWGRVVTLWHYSGDDERLGGADVGAIAATGRRIGLAAVCAALVVPLLLPSLNLHRPFHGGSGSGPRAFEVGMPDPVDQLHSLLTQPAGEPVLTYRSTAVAGDYLQVYVLNYNSAQGAWTLVQPGATSSVGPSQLARAPGLTAGIKVRFVTTQIKLGQVVGSSAGYSWPIFFLPVPYWPEQVNVPGTWGESASTLMIYSGSADHKDMGYSVTSGQAQLTSADLAIPPRIPPVIADSYLSFDSPVASQLRSIALSIVSRAHTPFQEAVALEQYFLQPGRFKYSLKSLSLPNNAHALLDFLTKDRVGSCQQFAFAMAALARLAGIPSRIAIGYTSGTRRAHGSWLVTTADAHAWPELYFTGIGWLRFEPTPGGHDGQGTAVQPTYLALGNPAGGSPAPSSNPGSSQPNGPTQRGRNVHIPHVQVPDSGTAAAAPVLRHKSSAPPIGQVVLVLLLVAAVAPGSTRIITRRRRWRTASGDVETARAAWLEVCADLDDFGLTCRASESPRAVARRVCAATDIDEPARQAIGRITTVVEHAKYAQIPATAGAIRSDVALVRRSLGRSVSWMTRLRAAFLPSSTLGPLAAFVRRNLGQLTGWVPSASERTAR